MGSDPLLSHLRVIPAEAGIQRLLLSIAINGLLNSHQREYNMVSDL